MWETIIEGNVNWFNYFGKIFSNIKYSILSYNNNTVCETTPELNVLKREPFIVVGGSTNASVVSCRSAGRVKQV